MQENRIFLKSWEPTRTPQYYQVETWRHRIRNLEKLQQHGLYFQFILTELESKNVLGMISYNNVIHHPFHACMLGYSLAENAQGKGYMQMALKVTNQYLFDEIHIHRIMAAYMPRNTRSGKVLERLGFEKEGLAKSYLMIDGRWEDHILTSLVNDAWIAPELL